MTLRGIAVRVGSAVVAAAVAAGALTPSAAWGRAIAEPSAATGRPSLVATGFPSTTTVGVPAQGSAAVSSPTLPSNARTARIRLLAESGSLTFDGLRIGLASLSNRDKLLACVSIGSAEMNPGLYWNPNGTGSAFVGLALMRACFAIVAELTGPKSLRGPSAAGVACPAPEAFKAPVVMGRSGAAYTADIQPGTASRATRSKVVVRCRVMGDTMVWRVRPRSRTKTLRKVLGPRVNLGVANPSTSSGSMQVTFLPPR